MYTGSVSKMPEYSDSTAIGLFSVGGQYPDTPLAADRFAKAIGGRRHYIERGKENEKSRNKNREKT